MKATWPVSAMLAAALLFGASAAHANGEKLFKQHCAACHAIERAAPLGMGPNLLGIVGKKAGIMEGFRYSAEFKKALADEKWTETLLDKWLEEPQNVAAGTYMMYKQGDPAIRKAIIDYLKTVK